ncbi:hypothetical protein [Streptomyces venezuelae]|uniref:hypothetical protein n=1 Tax=Streptomyces venezuelae TaxID=54571 RepID=UPI001681A8A9|nr:hypothetical protein [Streptomyces venezuelae]
MITPSPDESGDLPPIMEYTLRTDSTARESDKPVVHLNLIEEPDVPPRQWMNQTDGTSAAFQVPEVSQQAISMHDERQATNLAYTWLARDLHAIGWLENRSPYFD